MTSIYERISQRLPSAMRRGGERVTLIPETGGQVETHAFLSDPFSEVEFGDRFSVASNTPVFLIPQKVLLEAGMDRGGHIYLHSTRKRFQVVEVQPTSYGHARLRTIEAD